MTFVIDSSVAVSWCFSDEAAPVSNAAFERLRGESAVAPALLWFEVRNALVMGERRNRISPERTNAFLASLDVLKIDQDRAPDSTATLHLARTHRLTVYDASYVELALRSGLPLVTLDRAMQQAAEDAGAAIFQP